MAGDPFAQANILLLKVLNPLGREPQSALALVRAVHERITSLTIDPRDFDADRVVQLLNAAQGQVERVERQLDDLQRSRQTLSLPFNALRGHLDRARSCIPADIIRRSHGPRVDEYAGEKRFARVLNTISSLRAQITAIRVSLPQFAYLTQQLGGEIKSITLSVANPAERQRRINTAVLSFAAKITVGHVLDALTEMLVSLQDIKQLIEKQQEWNQRLTKAEALYSKSKGIHGD